VKSEKIEEEKAPHLSSDFGSPLARLEAKDGQEVDLGPYPAFERPIPAECHFATEALRELHGTPDRTKSSASTVLDSLVRTILSQNTTDINSSRAFASLKARFPTYAEVLSASRGDVADAIRSGGLADTKAARIQSILATLREETGAEEPSLEHLRDLGTAEIKKQLSRFPGVGPKTVSCVLMFCLQRAEFPVDTHVWRISRMLGWVPAKAGRNEAYFHLNQRVPDRLKYDLHIFLIRHGKSCRKCAANGRPRQAKDIECPLACLKSARTVGGVVAVLGQVAK